MRIIKTIDHGNEVLERHFHNGTIAWYKNNRLHREDGPAVIDPSKGEKIWYQNGLMHREDGPAYENNLGMKVWLIHAKRHRIDGPAVIKPDGTEKWVIDDRDLSDAEVLAIKLNKELSTNKTHSKRTKI
jgi:hypothetical protein